MGTTLDRRRVLLGISALMGGAALSPTAAKALDAAAGFKPGDAYHRLNADQAELLKAIIDIIIPETDTPGAVGAGVDYYIDHMLTAVLNKNEGKAVTDFLIAFAKMHPDFPALSQEKQLRILTAIDDRLHEETIFAANYRSLKELTFIGYYTSEIGASEELAYDPVPGPFQNGLVSEFDRSWST